MVEQASFGCLLLPFRRVVVAVEDDPLVLFYHLRQQRLDRRVELLPVLLSFLGLGRDVIERFGDGDVERDVRERDALAGRDRPELELVAGERKWARAVSVAGIARQLGQDRYARVEDAAGLGRLRAAVFNL